MALVSYSDSEGSSDGEPQKSSKQNGPALGSTQLKANFAVDKTNPRKIRVNLQETKTNPSHNVAASDDEPAPKRQRTGGGAFSGFNSMLPAPKRDVQTRDGSGSTKGQPRKVFSLRTGPERGFDRESDAELKQFFAEQHSDIKTPVTNMADAEPPASVSETNRNSASVAIAPKSGAPMMFKPLSVARKPPKKKPSTNTAKDTAPQAKPAPPVASEESAKPIPKVNLFSAGSDLPNHTQSAASTTEYLPLVYEATEENEAESSNDFIGDKAYHGGPNDGTGHGESNAPAVSQSLDAIASDLNLSASARRQLFGRKPGGSNNAVNVINFNTDIEYAANEVLRASSEQIQHNPVRGPASGKHSLKQLVSMATGQRDALEESFATGRQNKKEAGSKYGW
jgi:hypothetical protein